MSAAPSGSTASAATATRCAERRALGSFTQGGSMPMRWPATPMPATACSASRHSRPGRRRRQRQTSANQFLGQIETGYRIGLPLPGQHLDQPVRPPADRIGQSGGLHRKRPSLYNLSVPVADHDLGAHHLRRRLRRRASTWVAAGRSTSACGWAGCTSSPTRLGRFRGVRRRPGPAVHGVRRHAAARQRRRRLLGRRRRQRPRLSIASYDGEVGGGTDNHALRVGFRMTW